jgi:murein DD-endopeptidase MepM/ murein hydrolase activator NlpD
VKAPPVKEPAANPHPEKAQTAKVEPVKAPAVKEPAANPHPDKAQTAKVESVKAAAVKEPVVSSRSEKAQTVKAEPAKAPVVKEPPTILPPAKLQTAAADPAKMPAVQEPTVNVQLLNRSMETASTKLADGFDFPVGKPDAEGYYKARGYRPGGHQGEDWDGVRGGDTDFKDPIYCIGDGIVVFARDVHLGWGNVVIVRHAYRESGMVKHIDSLYGHLNSILVRRGQKVARGQQVGTMGTAHGQYDAHLHLEIRKNLEIGMSRSKFQKNLSNYYDPTQFIASHRQLSGGGANFRVAMNTFTHDSAYHFDDARNFSARKRSTAESSAALKQATSSSTH